jgi:hypothetical protein
MTSPRFLFWPQSFSATFSASSMDLIRDSAWCFTLSSRRGTSGKAFTRVSTAVEHATRNRPPPSLESKTTPLARSLPFWLLHHVPAIFHTITLSYDIPSLTVIRR